MGFNDLIKEQGGNLNIGILPKCAMSNCEEKGIVYSTNSDIEVMKAKGFRSVPMIEIDNKVLNYLDAINWIKEI